MHVDTLKSRWRIVIGHHLYSEARFVVGEDYSPGLLGPQHNSFRDRELAFVDPFVGLYDSPR